MDTIERIHQGTEFWDHFFQEHKERYDFASRYCQGKDVLDAACGTGYGSDILMKRGAASVDGVDISNDALAEARKLYERDGLRFHQMDLANIKSIGKKYDVVVSFETLEHVPDPATLLADFREILKPGGKIVCSSPNRNFMNKTTVDNPFHISEMTYEQFKSRFVPHYTIDGEYHQTGSIAFSRYMDFYKCIEANAKAFNRSVFIKLENGLRRLMGRNPLQCRVPKREFSNVAKGDYPILPLETEGGPEYLTFLFVGTPK